MTTINGNINNLNETNNSSCEKCTGRDKATNFEKIGYFMYDHPVIILSFIAATYFAGRALTEKNISLSKAMGQVTQLTAEELPKLLKSAEKDTNIAMAGLSGSLGITGLFLESLKPLLEATKKIQFSAGVAIGTAVALTAYLVRR